MKKYGIWGLGTVGKSAVGHLSKQGYALTVFDSRQLSDQEKEFLLQHQAKHWHGELESFLNEQDAIIPSPGVDISSYRDKGISFEPELDLFLPQWNKPLIAVTGSLGKTTLVTVLGKILSANQKPALLGGNIGTPLLEILGKKDDPSIAYGLLELSSFQLEYAQPVRPTLAIITNIYANHLDRHRTFENYIAAKARIFIDQRDDQKVLLPLSLAPLMREATHKAMTFFSAEPPSVEAFEIMLPGENHYTFSDGALICTTMSTSGLHQELIPLSPDTISQGSHLVRETWVCALATSDILGLIRQPSYQVPELRSLEHRMEYVGEYRGVSFYNDSKSTIFEATLAGVNSLAPRRVHLLLGGLSKGVDRGPLVGALKDSVASIACFGKEAEFLSKSCQTAGIDSSMHATLDEALSRSLSKARPEEVVLLSPAGSSFDLYNNYEHRGQEFKKLVKNLSIDMV